MSRFSAHLFIGVDGICRKLTTDVCLSKIDQYHSVIWQASLVNDSMGYIWNCKCLSGMRFKDVCSAALVYEIIATKNNYLVAKKHIGCDVVRRQY
jgi:hypothetical protein